MAVWLLDERAGHLDPKPRDLPFIGGLKQNGFFWGRRRVGRCGFLVGIGALVGQKNDLSEDKQYVA